MTVYYLPSCKYKELHPASSRRIQAYLSAKPDHVIAGCCKESQGLFQAGDTVLNNCSSCALITDELSPHVQNRSIYEYLLEDPAFPWPDYHGEEITVQDCYRVRQKPQVMDAVRKCLTKMNFVPVETEENKERTMFDGVYRYRAISEKNLMLAPRTFQKLKQEYIEIQPPEAVEKLMKQHSQQYRTARVCVYCNSCLKGVQIGEAEGVHLLDLITANL
ncbi:MAG: hypothetical protein IKS32_03310 [Solobacterium sp.]|nr:hypothetical protein [Solobacterium sp.]